MEETSGLPETPQNIIRSLMQVGTSEIGAKSIDDLFATIPAEYRLGRDLNIPRAYAESEIVDLLRPAPGRERLGLCNVPRRPRLPALPAGCH